MPLPIRDGNQSLTTLSTILVSNAHIPAHTIVSLGTQAITDIATAVSGVELGPNTINALENITVTLGQVTITGGLTDAQLRASPVTIAGTVTLGAGTAQIGSVTVGNATTSSAVFVKICGERTGAAQNETREIQTDDDGFLYARLADPSSPSAKAVIYDPVAGNAYVNVRQTASVTIGSALPAGTNQIGSVTASGTVTANIGGIANSVTLPVRLFAEKFGEAPSGQDTLLVCNSSGMLLVDANSGGSSVLGYDGNAFVQVKQVSGSSVTVGNPVTVGAIVGPLGGSVFKGSSPSSDSIRVLPYFSQNGSANYLELSTSNPFPIAGTVTLGVGTAQIGSVTVGNTVTIANIQGTSVTTSNFTSTTPSTVLAGFNATREVLTIFNEGSGNLHICAGATCTTLSYQVRLSAGDYYEAPLNQSSITHSAVFATAGTARVTQVS